MTGPATELSETTIGGWHHDTQAHATEFLLPNGTRAAVVPGTARVEFTAAMLGAVISKWEDT